MLHYTAYWLAKRESEWFDRLGRLLGTTWTREQVQRLVQENQKSATVPNETFIPLALAVNMDLLDWLKHIFRTGLGEHIGGGEYVPKAGEEVVELGDMPRDQWLDWIQGATPKIAESAARLNNMARPVSIREGPSDEARIERIRDQIARSKRW